MLVNTTTTVKAQVEYNEKEYNETALQNAEKALRKSLKTHKAVVNAFLKQYFFANRDRLQKALKEIQNEGYTKEVEKAFGRMVVFFGWKLPEQAQLDAYDAFLTAEKKEDDEKKPEGIDAVLALLLKKSQKGKENERQYYAVAYEAVKKMATKK